jgi:hypothetical protein
MKKLRIIIACQVFILVCLALAAAFTKTAEASTRSYFLPLANGQAVSACLADGTTCGKPAADHFCRSAGYDESILFAREPVGSALALDSEQLCEGASCQAFTRIKCYTPKGAEQANAG